ncbi:ABC transporter ATP-binding protein [Clostridium estertheticum]|uniref:ABC transporter ATP-binding protein n=1 Tax=Clostridium estertheticum TaxID=238834 RepID=A0AA47I8F1_9CLOT|nr:ABC transporter ATP-binding protein [Clostridium estertheticum]MBU3157950.1 ABC transporter ATP-binding protein [Clostridium estertheticum]WAG62528.1 ABC transporter ATP-binding protein [Clostridium estertheticum]
MEDILEIKNLNTSFFTHVGEVKAVRNVSITLEKGSALGIVGESGSGKSVTMLSIMKLLTDNGKVTGGQIIFDKTDITNYNNKAMRSIRGNSISMIFQDPMTSLNPVLTIGKQMIEPIMLHKKLSKQEGKKLAIDMLKLVGISSPETRLKQYPHEFSGGMRQRVMIAIAISCNPKLIIADEPTTALDVTIQAQILELFKDVRKKLNTSIILITHDLGIVADLCDSVNVMYGGCIVERGSTREIFYNAKHPYTWGLLNSVPNPKTLIREKLNPIEGQPPDLLDPPKGCPFAPRCDYAMEVCLTDMPEDFVITKESSAGSIHSAACWLNHPDAPKVERKLREAQKL